MIGFVAAAVLSFVPAFIYASIAYWLDRFEKEPRRLLFGAFLWGAFVATLGAIVWTGIAQASLAIFIGEASAEVAGATLLAPLVEESLKGIAVVIIMFAFPEEFDSRLDGMLYAAITALGFAATENLLYLYFFGYTEDGFGGLITLFVLRVILGGWGHAVYTAWIGLGLAMSRLHPNHIVRIISPFAGWLLAVCLHALHNTMAVFLANEFGLTGLGLTLLVDWSTWAVVLGLVIWEIRREQHHIAAYLAEEVAAGIISPAHYAAAKSFSGQLRNRTRSAAARRFYEACAELAHKKHHLATGVGNQRNTIARINQLRHEIAQLAPEVPAA
ncbi:PrsW family intramembrane metalloprotease [Chloroflexus sp.]|uniref:PrsW family intramembrane metalloprotease n=1 Tax=Chloroflexus sp. TaxID=1904827 RepID=UPI002ACE27F4|nr:PrsW family intramembrane metalloprotease [Chloroflexus sp.]